MRGRILRSEINGVVNQRERCLEKGAGEAAGNLPATVDRPHVGVNHTYIYAVISCHTSEPDDNNSELYHTHAANFSS